MEIKYTFGIATTKNEKKLILKMLSSLQKDLISSKIRNFEIIICLNNYNFQTKEELLNFSKLNIKLNIKIITSKPGLIQAQKQIIKESKSSKDFIIFYDSDIQIKNGTSKRFINFMEKNPSVIVGTGDQEAVKLESFSYNVYNIIGLNPQLMTPRKYIIGKDFAIRKEKYFVPFPMISDDTFLSHTTVFNYGKDSLKVVKGACVRYIGPKSFKDYYNKIRRLKLEREKMYKLHPEYKSLKNYFQKHWINREIKKLTKKEKIQLALQKIITWICFKTSKLSKAETWVNLNTTKDERVFI